MAAQTGSVPEFSGQCFDDGDNCVAVLSSVAFGVEWAKRLVLPYHVPAGANRTCKKQMRGEPFFFRIRDVFCTQHPARSTQEAGWDLKDISNHDGFFGAILKT